MTRQHDLMDISSILSTRRTKPLIILYKAESPNDHRQRAHSSDGSSCWHSVVFKTLKLCKKAQHLKGVLLLFCREFEVLSAGLGTSAKHRAGQGCAGSGRDPALPCRPGGPGWGSPREMSGSWRALGKKEESAESRARPPEPVRGRRARPRDTHRAAQRIPAPQLPRTCPRTAAAASGPPPAANPWIGSAAPAAPAAFVRGFGGFPGIQTPAIASAIFASSALKPSKPPRRARRAGTMRSEWEPPCLMRAGSRAGRAAAMLAEGRAGRVPAGRHLE